MKPKAPFAVLSGWLAALILTSAGLPAQDAPKQRAFLERHCFGCHDADTKKGGLDLTALPAGSSDPQAFASWVTVYDRLAAGEMPPEKKPAPPAADKEQFLAGLSATLIAAEKAQSGSGGRAVWRRLNRHEYENTLRDLLDAPWLQVKDMLPEDGEAHRFNKVGEALDMSHVQMARYLGAAESALRQVMAPGPERPEKRTTRHYARDQRWFSDYFRSDVRTTVPLLGLAFERDVHAYKAPVTVGSADPERREREAMGVVVSTYAGITIGFNQFRAPVTGRYRLRFSAYSFWVAPESAERRWTPDFNQVSTGRRAEPVTVYAVGSSHAVRRLGAFDAEPGEPVAKELEVWLLAGESIRPDAARLFRFRPPRPRNPLAEADGMPGVAFRWMEAEGPLLDQWPSAGHQLLFGDLPIHSAAKGGARTEPSSLRPGVAVSAHPEEDAERLLRNFMQRAYRRPLVDADLAVFRDIIHGARRAGHHFTDAMLAGYAAVLCSPAFLYLAEEPGRLDDHALAARLAYFLWNSCPDEELRRLAAAGELRRPEVLRAQTERLLDDPKSRRFVGAFLGYWLDLRKLTATDPDATLYPDYLLDELLVESMLAETQLFFGELLRRNLGVTHLVASDFTMLNERLATHYGIPGVMGVALRPVSLPAGGVRGGLMTQASVLKVTANGTTTSPVLRGAWVMERILGQRPPPPPAGVAAVEPDTRGATTIREQLALHRAVESCAACHAKIDPVGFALESFDVMGGWRERYRSLGEGKPVSGYGHNGQAFKFRTGRPVDASGALLDGRSFADVRELKRHLLTNQEQLARNLVQQLLVYATGAPVRFADRAAVSRILARSQPGGHGVRTLVHEIVQSDLFQTK